MTNNPAGEIEAKYILDSFNDINEFVYINNKKVFCSLNTSGGGQTFGQDFVPLIKEIYPNRIFKSCLEWCAGPGFIGISLYSHKLCKSISFFEKNKEAVNQLEKTKKVNNFGDEFKIIHGDNIFDLSEKYDLIVANPPHFSEEIYFLRNAPKHLWLDKGWKVHINFFNNIKKNLSKNGVILLQECSMSSSFSSFELLIQNTGLKITRNFIPSFAKMKYIYYVEIKHDKED